jgi:type IV pilus assembly protein PilC
VLITAAVIIYINDKLRTWFANKIINKLFSKKRVAVTLSSAKFSDALSICLSSGMDTDESLKASLKINSNPFLAEKITSCLSLLQQGVSSADAFVKSGLFSGLYTRMLAVGFITGSADEIMREIAKRLSSQASEEITAAVSRVEPAVVILLSVIVGAILLSVMIPLMSIMSVIG